MLEYYTPLKKGSLKVHTLKKFAATRTFHFIAALRAAQHDLYTSNLLPTPMYRHA